MKTKIPCTAGKPLASALKKAGPFRGCFPASSFPGSRERLCPDFLNGNTKEFPLENQDRGWDQVGTKSHVWSGLYVPGALPRVFLPWVLRYAR